MAHNKERRQKKLLKCLEEDPVVSIACKKANVGRATYYEWRDNDKEFAKAVAIAMSKGDEKYCDVAMSQIMKSITEGNVRAAMFVLNNLHPKFTFPKALARDRDPEDVFEPVRVMGSLVGPDEK